MSSQQNANQLKIGLLGESEGNGHPFSWSAIFNGYEPTKMLNCGYNTIPEYLMRQKWDKPHIPNAQISYIWTPNIDRSKFIASTCKNVKATDSLSDLEGKVDAFIIARDDYINNLDIAKKICYQGKPILFDKQISMSYDQTLEIIKYCKIHKAPIFTGSAIAKNNDFPIKSWIEDPQVKTIKAITPKKWENYAIHIVEPLIKSLTDCELAILDSVEVISSSNQKTTIAIKAKRRNMPSCTLTIIADQNHKRGFLFTASDEATKELQTYEITDPFNCFKQYLIEFVAFCRLFQNPHRAEEAQLVQNSIIAHHLKLQAIIDLPQS